MLRLDADLLASNEITLRSNFTLGPAADTTAHTRHPKPSGNTPVSC